MTLLQSSLARPNDTEPDVPSSESSSSTEHSRTAVITRSPVHASSPEATVSEKIELRAKPQWFKPGRAEDFQVAGTSRRLLPRLEPQVLTRPSKVVADWEGLVISVGEDSFQARVRDRRSPENVETDLFTIPIEMVDDDDMDLLQEGGVFYLSIAKEILSSGRQKRVTELYFRRMPGWTKSVLEAAEQRGTELADYFSEQRKRLKPSQ